MNKETAMKMLDTALPFYPFAHKVSKSYLMDLLEEADIFLEDDDDELSICISYDRLYTYMDSKYRYNYDEEGQLVSPPVVLHSPAGYYIGRDYYVFAMNAFLPYARESGYHKKRQSAEIILTMGAWWR